MNFIYNLLAEEDDKLPDLNRLLENLELIKNIPQNTKMCVRGKRLIVDETGPFQTLRRGMYRDSRKKTLRWLTKVYESSEKFVLEICDTDVESKEKDSEWESRFSGIYSKEQALECLMKALQESAVGLQALRDTYKEDIPVSVKYTCLLQRLTRITDRGNQNI